MERESTGDRIYRLEVASRLSKKCDVPVLINKPVRITINQHYRELPHFTSDHWTGWVAGRGDHLTHVALKGGLGMVGRTESERLTWRLRWLPAWTL